MRITPQSFWHCYKQQLREIGSWNKYQSNRSWTRLAKAAAIRACENLGLKTGMEYLRLDVIGYTQRTSDPYHWDLRIAFEVENSAEWRDEFCKLSNVVADLRVLVAYELSNPPRAFDTLRHHVKCLRDRLTLTPRSKWLIILGPHWRNSTDCWNAFTISSQGKVFEMKDSQPLRGCEMGTRTSKRRL
jgi:hypothetical protein